MVLRLLSVSFFPLRRRARSSIGVDKSWCSSRDYRSRLRSCVHSLLGYLAGWSCHNLGRCSGPTIPAATLLLILPYEVLVLLAQKFTGRAQCCMPRRIQCELSKKVSDQLRFHGWSCQRQSHRRVRVPGQALLKRAADFFSSHPTSHRHHRRPTRPAR